MHLRRPFFLAVLATALALVLLLVQHWGMMLSNSDDPWITRSSLEQVFETASSQGRFWLIPINIMAGLPYKLGSWGAANALKMLVNGLVLVAFVVFCMRLTNRWVGLLMGMVWLALIDVSPGYYSPFHGFLMMFNLQFAVLFASFALYLGQLDNPEKTGPIVAPFLLYAFAMLAYEPMFFYSAAYPALFLYRNLQRETTPQSLIQWAQLIRQFTVRHYPLALVLLAYVACYFGYRQFQPTAGRSLDSGGSLWDIAITVYKFSINGFHIQFKPLNNYLPTLSEPRNLVLALLYGASIALAMFLVLPRVQGEAYPQRLYSKTAITVLLFFVFCPNLLLGMVAAYRQWAAEDPHYVGNYLSSFALAMVVTLLLLTQVGGLRAKREKVLFAAVLFLFFSSACDNYVRWSNLAEINRRDSQLWFQAIAQLHERAYPADSATTICAKNTPEKVSGDDRYWSSYLSEVLRTHISYTSKSLGAAQCDVNMDFNTWRFAGAARKP